mmetsp:Transcript_861/g.911  ORF Transcript_861/g.911 Transcript_861/m.911 type:complete len:218 (-) Transcript_861:410-1063(-)
MLIVVAIFLSSTNILIVSTTRRPYQNCHQDLFCFPIDNGSNDSVECEFASSSYSSSSTIVTRVSLGGSIYFGFFETVTALSRLLSSRFCCFLIRSSTALILISNVRNFACNIIWSALIRSLFCSFFSISFCALRLYSHITILKSTKMKGGEGGFDVLLRDESDKHLLIKHQYENYIYLALTVRTNPSPTNSAPSFRAFSVSMGLILFTLYPDDHIVM